MTKPQEPERSVSFLLKGRAACSNAVSRYESSTREAIDDGWGNLDEPLEPLRTEVIPDSAKSIINYVNSPDIPFDRTINPYRGCEHGCIYCYARPTHAYLGYSPGLDFESRILIKPDAPALLKKELAKPGYKCAPIALGMNTDAYQPVERRYGITRALLEVLAEANHPFSLVTKSSLVERDIDIIAPMASKGLAAIYVSITTLDRTLARKMEPRASAPDRRLETLAKLYEAGIPTGVMVAPMIPSLNDAEMESILAAAKNVGVQGAGYVFLRLPLELVELFEQWLYLHYPLKAHHVLSLVRQSRGGKHYDANFKTRMTGEGVFSEAIAKRFRLACQRLGLNQARLEFDCSQFSVPQAWLDAHQSSQQMTLF